LRIFFVFRYCASKENAARLGAAFFCFKVRNMKRRRDN
jgi:hypothetical protein